MEEQGNSAAIVIKEEEPEQEEQPEEVKQEQEQERPLTRRSMAGATRPGDREKEKCPRCNSMDTKFCYFNNYSLSQPRHYCKACRRYWTKGGTLRNVPVGGGCRKGKRSKLIKTPSSPPSTPPPPPPSAGGNGDFLSTLASFGLPNEDFNLPHQQQQQQPPQHETNYQSLLFDVDGKDGEHQVQYNVLQPPVAPDMSAFWVNKGNNGTPEESSSQWMPDFPGYAPHHPPSSPSSFH
ncbi:hypothetical protein H6P81_019440 [Aristolochia fimbriata]|uniref:Dof zinc finger protein n=1 Tax=Aristolochia fimbriata TaxID=158543 RepID=A0AAV7DRR9_ARIFI|nr:hypothetical protein H6P81_019440 [Aristolochia fimbriata]